MLPESSNEIERLTIEILLCKQLTAIDMIEIGRRLIRVKELLPHGEWGKWLKEKVSFGERTAQRFMQAAASLEFSTKPSTLTDLTQSKVYKLLELSSESIEKFIHQPHVLSSGESKTVQEMTNRELDEVIKASKEAERIAKEVHSNVDDLVSEVQRLNSQLFKQPEPKIITKEVIPESIKSETERLIREKDKPQSEDEILKLDLEEAKEKANQEPQIVNVIPEDYEKLKAKFEEQQTELHRLTRAVKDKQKVKTDATLLVQELVKKTEKLKIDYAQVNEPDRDTDQHIESAAKVCDRMAQELRSLILKSK